MSYDVFLIGGLVLTCLFGLLVMVGSYLRSSAALARDRIPAQSSGKPSERFAFAAVDVANGDTVTVAKEASDAARRVELLLPYTAAIPELARKMEMSLVFQDGTSKRLQGRSDPIELRFCIGDSVEGAGVPSGSLLAVVGLDGEHLAALVEKWGKEGAWKPGALLEEAGIELNLEKYTIRWPSGLVLSRGNLISIKMPTEMYDVYVQALEHRPKLVETLGPHLGNSFFNKIRIFGGIVFDQNRGPLLETFRFPPGTAKPAGPSTRHSVDRLNGLVVGSWPEDTWSSWLPGIDGPTRSSQRA